MRRSPTNTITKRHNNSCIIINAYKKTTLNRQYGKRLKIILKKYMPPLYNSLGIYLPLITTNCAVLGVTILNIDSGYTFGESMVNSFGAGVGFLVAMVMFAGVRERLESCNVPKFLEGLPITLVAASLVSLSFLGFTGMVEGMFA